MAVATRRPGFTPWIAWVGAGTLGAAVAAWASQPGDEILLDPGSTYLVPIILAAPLALLQLLVLRGLLGVSIVAAGIWFCLMLAASLASVFAISWWYSVAPDLLQRAFGIETGMDFVFAVGDYIKPLLLSLAQAVVLAWVFGRGRIGVLWLVTSLAAYAISIRLTFAVTAMAFDERTVGFVLPFVVFAALDAAITGVVLVAIWRTRAPVTAPQRSLPAV